MQPPHDAHDLLPAIYSTVEAAVCTGFSVRQLDYWARQGLVIPSVRAGAGRGSCRRYALEDLVRLRFIHRLKQSGLSSQKIRHALTSLHEIMIDPNPLRHALWVHEPGLLVAIFKTDQGRRVLIDALNAGGQQVLEIVLETLAEETQRELAQRK